jgi:hypothetical protein
MIVFTREQERGPLPAEISVKARRLGVELRRQLRIGRFLDELEGREQVVGPTFEIAPQLDLRSEGARLAENLLGRPLVVPEPGLCRQPLEMRGARLFRPEVKDAPRSTGSAPRDPGLWTSPLIPDLEILEQDRAELDQAQR